MPLEDTMTQRHAVHPSQNLIQTPATLAPPVASRILTSSRGIQVEEAAVAGPVAVAVTVETRGTTGRSRASPRGWSPGSSGLSWSPWLEPSPASLPTRKRSCASKRTPTRARSTWKTTRAPTLSHLVRRDTECHLPPPPPAFLFNVLPPRSCPPFSNPVLWSFMPRSFQGGAFGRRDINIPGPQASEGTQVILKFSLNPGDNDHPGGALWLRGQNVQPLRGNFWSL